MRAHPWMALVIAAAYPPQPGDEPLAAGQPAVALTPRVADFPAGARFRGPPVPADFAQDTAARRFRTRLRWAAGDTVNFAGHLRLVLWGCGTGCQSGAVVDARSGRVTWLPAAAEVGAAYRAESRLLVLDPPEEIAAAYPAGDAPARLRPRSYVWADTGWAAWRPPGKP